MNHFINMIEERYPSLALYYSEWQTIYEFVFERQKCYLESGKEVFPRVDKRVTWETESLVIACWLAFQDNMERVEYKPSRTYRLEGRKMEGKSRRFLADMEALLKSQLE